MIEPVLVYQLRIPIYLGLVQKYSYKMYACSYIIYIVCYNIIFSNGFIANGTAILETIAIK